MKIQFDFSDKRVLVTGSTMGIGRAAAEAFRELGATVAINGRTDASVAKAIAELGGGPHLVAAPGDLSTTTEINTVIGALLARWDGIDVLVNNAGRGDDCVVDNVTEEYWEKMLALNLKGAFFTTQACIPALKVSRGCVVNVASGLGVMGGPPGSVVYSTTKTAMVQMTKMMALEFAQQGVRVNAIVPGWIDTPMIRTENERLGDNGLFDYIELTTPVGRIGTSEEMAGAILYLAAPFASFTTGSVLVADGGLTSGHYV
ncbi:MAG: SDR family oxidoreductase [Steroidobacteraceae bacterium]|jgi:NAD(P)-dependent dehydrogenase (short-subunit alcohol dehydrogenase family)